MNKLIGFNVNRDGVYGLSVQGNEVLRLHKRIVQLGIGTCLAFTMGNFYNQETPISSSWENQDRYFYARAGIGCIITGLYEKKALAALSLISGLISGLLGIYLESLEFAFTTNIVALSVIGQSLIAAGSFFAFLFGLSLLIKKFGNEQLNRYLDSFNKLQDSIEKVVFGKYVFSFLNSEIFVIKKQIAIGMVLFFAAISADLDPSKPYNPMASAFNLLLGIGAIYQLNLYPVFLLALTTFWKILEKSENVSQLLIFLGMSCRNYAKFVGQGTFLAGALFLTLAGLGLLAKKSGNKKIMQLAEYYAKKVKDPIKVKENQRMSRVILSSPNSEPENDQVWITEKAEKADINLAPPRLKKKTKGKPQVKAVTNKTKTPKTQNSIKIELNGCERTFQRMDSDSFKKEVWAVIVADSVEKQTLICYEKALSNGCIGPQSLVRALTVQGTYEIDSKGNPRLIGKIYKEGVRSFLEKALGLESDNALLYSQELDRKGISNDVFLILFSKEAKKHENIYPVAESLKAESLIRIRVRERSRLK